MNDPAKPVSHPWRRFLRFSMRGMIVVVLVMGGGLGWLVRSAHIQRDAVAAIQHAGGNVLYSWERNNRTGMSGGKPWAPTWLADLIGVDYFGHVTTVWFVQSSKTTDSVLAQVGCLTGAREVQFKECSVSDAGMAHLRGLRGLSYLDLSGTHITDAGLAHLKGLTNLSGLFLTDTHISDAGLVHVEGLTNLHMLSLARTQVSVIGLARLKRLTKLKELLLDGSQARDAGEREFQRALPNLKVKVYP
jgi:internalin A